MGVENGGGGGDGFAPAVGNIGDDCGGSAQIPSRALGGDGVGEGLGGTSRDGVVLCRELAFGEEVVDGPRLLMDTDRLGSTAVGEWGTCVSG